MSKKPKGFLFLLVLICALLLGSFSYWWLTIPSQTLSTFIASLEKGDTKTINALLESPFQFESSGDKQGFIGFKEKSPKRKLKIWQDALKKEIKIKKRNLGDYFVGKTQATIRVESMIYATRRRLRVRGNQKRSLEPKTLNLTIIANLNRITLKQKLEEPNESNIILLYSSTY